MADSECFYVYVLGAVNNFFLSFYMPADRDPYLNTHYTVIPRHTFCLVCLAARAYRAFQFGCEKMIQHFL
jgi:hypothetical protein